ncbi:MAG: 50S ribosomal protein L29 [Acetanaerobacterium sp.]
MKAVEIRKLSGNELGSKLTDLKAELFNLRFQHAINQLDNPLRIKTVKRDIARIKTIIKQKENQGVQ